MKATRTLVDGVTALRVALPIEGAPGDVPDEPRTTPRAWMFVKRLVGHLVHGVSEFAFEWGSMARSVGIREGATLVKCQVPSNLCDEVSYIEARDLVLAGHRFVLVYEIRHQTLGPRRAAEAHLLPQTIKNAKLFWNKRTRLRGFARIYQTPPMFGQLTQTRQVPTRRQRAEFAETDTQSPKWTTPKRPSRGSSSTPVARSDVHTTRNRPLIDSKSTLEAMDRPQNGPKSPPDSRKHTRRRAQNSPGEIDMDGELQAQRNPQRAEILPKYTIDDGEMKTRRDKQTTMASCYLTETWTTTAR